MKLRRPDFLKSSLEHYRDSLQEALTCKAQIYREKSAQKKLPMVYTLIFEPTAERPLTSFSYGLSFATHPDQPRKTELCLQTRSTEPVWGHVVGYLANHLRGDCPFKIGQIIKMGQAISPDSDLDAFLVVPPIENTIPSTTGDGKKRPEIHLVELVPVFAHETAKIQRLGVIRFIDQLGNDRLDPRRSAL